MGLAQPLQLIGLLAIHWVGDFVLQSHWMSVNKSKRLDALAIHVATYTATLFAGSALLFGVHEIAVLALFCGVNGILHFATDFVTSQVTSRLWQQQRERLFFVAVGFDQLIHQATLVATLWLLFTSRN
jgi:hypothetical protein